jgi:hypothetical protein
MHQRLADAARRAGNHYVTLVQYEDDHPFSAHRLELADLLTKWLSSDCADTQGVAR